jgi:hypothetical protein
VTLDDRAPSSPTRQTMLTGRNNRAVVDQIEESRDG